MPRIPAAEFDARRRALSGELERRKLDGLVVSAAPNVRYLTGFTGSNAAVLIGAGEALLFTDPRYQLQAAQEAACKVKIARGPLLPALAKQAARRRLRRLGFEKGRLSYADYELLREHVAPGTSLEPLGGIIEKQRMLKSEAEIELMRAAALLNSKAFERAVKEARPGITEAALAAEFDYQMRLLGAEKSAFDTIVAAGPRTALPHARPTANALVTNQLLLIDMGAIREGYASDMTRMAFLGTPGSKVKRLYRTVLEAQQAATAAVKPGVSAAQVDRVARRLLGAYGLDSAFVHSTGHGLGLEVHEPPRLGKRERMRLAPGMVLTIEPGVYLEGFGGIRIEDTVVVTRSGCDVITPSPRELLLL